MAGESDVIRTRMALNTLDALVRVGEHLLGEAQRLAPKEEGTLRGSAALVIIVNGRRIEGSGARGVAEVAVRGLAKAKQPISLDVEVSFNTVYAARQHEELDWHHDEGQAKYLEQPFRQNLPRYEAILVAAAGRGL